MFARAIVRSVPETISAGLTTAELGTPDAEQAREQHRRYIAALEECGLEVTVLDADERYPDSVFIEDTAVVTDRCVIVTNPGATERRDEVHEVEKALAGLYGDVERITPPGTLDGGDVLQVGDHFFIGLTQRTNREGAGQLAAILQGHGFG
ncbi:MAG: arginine deiminase family protein, partial [Rubrobacter sp.]